MRTYCPQGAIGQESVRVRRGSALIVGGQLAAIGLTGVVLAGDGHASLAGPCLSGTDGYTLTVQPAAFLATNKSVFKNLPYDPEKDLTPISELVNQSVVLVVRSASNNRTSNNLVAAAKACSGKLTYATAGGGSSHHLAAVLFEHRAKVKMTHVPYKGSAVAMNDVLGGNVDIVFAGLPEALPHIKSGRIRALGLLSETRSVVAADISHNEGERPGRSVGTLRFAAMQMGL